MIHFRSVSAGSVVWLMASLSPVLMPLAHAQDLLLAENAPLDAKYSDIQPPIDDVSADRADASRSDINGLISWQTPVRDQQQRGTCSIFASTGMLESMLRIRRGFPASLDLSEEWLEYIATRNHAADGSSNNINFSIFREYGSPQESYLPYLGETWDQVGYSDLSQQRCGSLKQPAQQSCLFGHRSPDLLTASVAQLSTPGSAWYDPQFLAAAQNSIQMRNAYMNNIGTNFALTNVSTIKSLLQQGIPVAIGIDFFFGAWNHRLAPDYGMKRDTDAWDKGVVGYPEIGSIDRDRSPAAKEGHAVILVGYDDNAIINTHVQMTDGTERDFSYRGVYYFKNSWGTGSFGKKMSIDGQSQPGYGMITQRYAHEFAGFSWLPLQ